MSTRWALRIIGLLASVMLCTCGPAPEAVFLERKDTGVTSSNQLTPTERLNIVEYLYYYNGGGVAATDISGDGLPDLYFTNNQGENRYYINEGNWHFRDATGAGGVAGAMNWSTGVSVEDVNADGLPDIYVCNVGGYGELTGRNELFVQQADGTFTEQATEYGLDFSGFNTQAYWFDYDLDGDNDLYLLRHSVHNDATYGEARARQLPDSLAGDKLLQNDGGTFTDVTQEMGIYSSKIGYGLSVAIADYDADGYPDLYVCNDFSENDYLYLNQGGKGFTEAVRERMGHTSNFSMGSDVGDLDGDGRPDLVSLDMRPGNEEVLKSTASTDAYNVYRIKRRSGYYDQLPRNNVQWNRGGGYFSEIAELTGLATTDWSWSVLLEDFNLDSRQEVFVANGIERRPNDLDYLKFVSSSLGRASGNLAVIEQMPGGRVANQLFVSEEELHYAEADWGLGYVGSSTGAASADLDGDGDLDLVLNNVNAPAMLYENRTITPEKPAVPAPTQPSLRRYCNQRGFMSQSAPAVAPSIPPVEPADVRYRAVSFDTITVESEINSFDREPLQPYANARLGDTLGYTLAVEVGDHRIEAGPWLPLRVATQVAGEWVYEVLPGTNGWWQSLTVVETEVGPEVIAGNWGLNSGLGEPTEAAPLRLYRKDIDNNGRLDPLITYERAGREYTLADKDDLSKQFPSWRRNNLSYTEFSQRDFAENFPEIGVEPLVATTLAHHRLRFVEGKWSAVSLPRAAQLSPVTAALGTPAGILLGGNHLDVLPRIGRQDGAALQLLRRDGSVTYVTLPRGLNYEAVTSLTAVGQGRIRVASATGFLSCCSLN